MRPRSRRVEAGDTSRRALNSMSQGGRLVGSFTRIGPPQPITAHNGQHSLRECSTSSIVMFGWFAIVEGPRSHWYHLSSARESFVRSRPS